MTEQMKRAKQLMTEAANAILADDPNAATLAEHALGQLKRAQLDQGATEAGLSELDAMQIRSRAARAAWGYDTAPKLEVVK